MYAYALADSHDVDDLSEMIPMLQIVAERLRCSKLPQTTVVFFRGFAPWRLISRFLAGSIP